MTLKIYKYFNIILKPIHSVFSYNKIISKIRYPDFSNVSIMSNSFVDSNCKIGEYTYIGRNCSITKATIGRYCSLANNVSIGQGEHSTDNISTSSLFYDDAYDKMTEKECVIGNDVWIGVDAIVRRGVTIGDGAIIGANSFVNKDVPPFAVAVGSPAKVIKYRFNEHDIQIISNLKWWIYDLKRAGESIKECQKIINNKKDVFNKN